MRLQFWVIFVFSLFAFFSQSFGLNCRNPMVSVYFGNGMFNSRNDAEKSARALQEMLTTHSILPKTQSVKIAYNLNEPALEELLQVADQKESEAGRSYWRWLSQLSLAPEWFHSLAKGVAAMYDEARYLVDVDLQKQVVSYRSEITSGRTVLTIAHSQGNFYANSSWHLLASAPVTAGRFFIVGVAAPVNSIAGDGSYTTLTQDRVIDVVRIIADSLPSNETNSQSDLWGHEFVGQYLHGDRSGPRIMEQIRSTMELIASAFESPMGPTDLTDSSLVHESLLPFLSYVRTVETSNKKSPLTPAECLAISAFAKTFDWWGEPCEERSLSALEKWMDRCATEEWTRKDGRDFGRCSLLGDGSLVDQGERSTPAFAFILADHQECIWHEAQIAQMVTPELLTLAKEILRRPPL
jgi:hypothetical protein